MIAVAIDIGGTFTDLVGFDGKAGPSKRIASVERLDAVANSAVVMVQIDKYAVVFDRRRRIGRWPMPGNVWAQSIEAFDQSYVAAALQFHTGSERKVAPAALTRDDDPRRIDSERRGVGVHPL